MCLVRPPEDETAVQLVRTFAVDRCDLIQLFLAFFEYCFQVPANRMGFRENGGPFNLIQLKVIQEVITLVVFVAFSAIAFKGESFKWNHALACLLLVAAVYLVFKK